MKYFFRIFLSFLFLGGIAFGTYSYIQRAQAEQELAQANGAKPAAGGGGGGGGAARAPIRAEGVRVERGELSQVLSVVGNLVANEAVVISSEQSRRLAKVLIQEGTTVEAGDLLFKLDDSDLKVQISELDARLELANLEFNRIRDLRNTNVISQQEYDVASVNIKVLEAQRELIENTLVKTEIRAPFSGRVGMRAVSEGAWVTPSDPLATLLNIDQVKVDFKIPERYAGRIVENQTLSFRPEGRGDWFQATLTVIDPSIDALTRSVSLRGTADNPNKSLLPGTSAIVQFPLSGQVDGFPVPAQAIIPSPRGSSVFLAEDGKVAQRNVELGARTADRVQVIAGLEGGEVILISNLLRLRPGMPVEVYGLE